jgi:tetratricopeptide (TPR) repeat protein
MDAEMLNAALKREVEKNSATKEDLPAKENADGCSENSLARLKQWHLKLAQDVESFKPRPAGTSPSHAAALRSALPDLEMRAEQGSITARNYLRAYELLLTAAFDAFNWRDSGLVFRNFRAAKKLWENVPALLFLEKFGELAREALAKNPEDADALHVLVYTQWLERLAQHRGDFQDLVPMAQRCVALQPRVPEFHVMLGFLYLHQRDNENVEKAVKCSEEAYALENNLELLFFKGDCLFRLSSGGREAIKAFEQFVEGSEKDEPKSPLACYLAAAACVRIAELRTADEFFKKGEEMEKHAIPSPFHGALTQNMCKFKADVKRLMEDVVVIGSFLTGVTCEEFANHDYSSMKCGECGKTESTLSTCGRCREMRYCGQECQKKHWPTHKKLCKKK